VNSQVGTSPAVIAGRKVSGVRRWLSTMTRAFESDFDPRDLRKRLMAIYVGVSPDNTNGSNHSILNSALSF